MSAGDILVSRHGVRAFGRRLPAAIGRGGITGAKREGDGATPTGIHHIAGLLYRPDRLARPAPWAEPILPGDLWSDDPGQPDYNHAVRAPYPFSHESLRRADPLYDAILVTDWNWPEAEPGRGSAIFLHLWRRPRYPTEGCVAFARADFLWLLARAAPGTRLIVRG
ncbi:L,D-transpeptidase family protein [Mangrovicoccus algicola]|uniref:L,D-transpeptidase family protein n=1 Tax=Mangrovicoccus algicola TaxID=2771008 RepID=A0A8J6YVS3_9RHOB|nr:L,D-transpeptidase family protein [Mangrovicoccus algicola]